MRPWRTSGARMRGGQTYEATSGATCAAGMGGLLTGRRRILAVRGVGGAMSILCSEYGARVSRLVGELTAERDILRLRLNRAVFQRDALLFVVAGMLFGIVIWRWL